jgi:hypothetical protein
MINNKHYLDILDGDEITFYYYLYKNIENGKVNTLTTKSSSNNTYQALTFYFDINGNLIIY